MCSRPSDTRGFARLLGADKEDEYDRPGDGNNAAYEFDEDAEDMLDENCEPTEDSDEEEGLDFDLHIEEHRSFDQSYVTDQDAEFELDDDFSMEG